MYKVSKTKILTFKSLFFLHISSPKNDKLLEEKHLFFFTHVTTTLSTEAHTLQPSKHTSHTRLTLKGPCQMREGLDLPAFALPLHRNKCLKKIWTPYKESPSSSNQVINILMHKWGYNSVN